MKFSRINKLMAVRDNYHPLISKLFRKYPSKGVSLVMNSIVGLCCFILLASAFLGMAYFYSGYGDVNKILSISAWLIFSFSFIFSIRSVYSFLYSGKDLNLLKTLPVTRSEIIASNYVYFYKKQIFVSLYLMSAALYGLFKFEPNGLQIFVGVLLALVIPVAAITLSVLLSFLVFRFVKRIELSKKRQRIEFSRKMALLSLLNYEIQNFRKFASLKMEIGMQVLFSAALTINAVNVDVRYLAAVAVYPALSMVNISSFSREGEFYSILQSLPIKKLDRLLAKVLSYLLVELPIILVCFVFVALKKGDMDVFVSLVPSILFLVNVTLAGVVIGRKNPKIHWTNPQEAFQLNLPFMIGAICLGILTESASFLFGTAGLVAAIVMNIFAFVAMFLKRLQKL